MFERIRDSIKDLAHFKQILSYFEEDFEYFGDVIKKPPTEAHVLRSHSALAESYLSKVYALYSAGESIKEITPSLVNCIHHHSEGRQDKFFIKPLSILSYDDLITLFSLSILFRIDKESLFLVDTTAFHAEGDLLLSTLSARLSENSPISTNETYGYFEYALPTKVLQATDDKTRIDYLKEYLDNYLDIMRGNLVWPDSHLRNSYKGYWAFVVGALVVILELDDTDLRDCQFYPKDLVDYYRSGVTNA